jgi:hypothetical protein
LAQIPALEAVITIEKGNSTEPVPVSLQIAERSVVKQKPAGKPAITRQIAGKAGIHGSFGQRLERLFFNSCAIDICFKNERVFDELRVRVAAVVKVLREESVILVALRFLRKREATGIVLSKEIETLLCYAPNLFQWMKSKE